MAYEVERQRLTVALSDPTIQIEHIGSTSVQGLAAKPIIDIQIGVTDLVEFDNNETARRIEAIGYTHRTDIQHLVPYRRFFHNRDSVSDHRFNIHLVETSHPWWERHLLFRDYLRANDRARDRYGDLKLSLSEKEWEDVAEYNASKDELIWQLEDEAFAHFEIDESRREVLRSSRIL